MVPITFNTFSLDPNALHIGAHLNSFSLQYDRSGELTLIKVEETFSNKIRHTFYFIIIYPLLWLYRHFFTDSVNFDFDQKVHTLFLNLKNELIQKKIYDPVSKKINSRQLIYSKESKQQWIYCRENLQKFHKSHLKQTT